MKRKLLIIPLILCLLFSVNVGAKSAVVVDDLINEEGTFNQSKFRFGKEIDSNATINGLNISFAEKINTRGKSDYLINFADSLTVNETVSKDTFLFASNINIGSDAILKRDVYLFAANVKVNTDIPGDARIYAGDVDLSGIKIKGNATIYADNINVKNTVIDGTLKYSAESITGLTKETAKDVIKKEVTKDSNEFANKVMDFITKIIGMFLLVAILFKIFPRLKKYFDKININDELSNFGYGLLLLLLPIPLVLMLITVVLLRLTLLLLMLYLTLFIIAIPLTSYVIGKYLFNKYNIKISDYLILFISILGCNLISLVPFIGPLLVLFMVILFFTIFYGYLKKIRK